MVSALSARLVELAECTGDRLRELEDLPLIARKLSSSDLTLSHQVPRLKFPLVEASRQVSRRWAG